LVRNGHRRAVAGDAFEASRSFPGMAGCSSGDRLRSRRGVGLSSFALPPNPFPGLRPFREDEEALFFGREAQVDSMIDKLASTRFLAVVGTSGSGQRGSPMSR
jgi:hypothetical protein